MLICLVSCENDGAPRGMKLASDNSKVDYLFYIPEEWTVDEMSDFSRAHAESDAVSVSVFTFPLSEDIEISEWWSATYLPTLQKTLYSLSSLDSGKTGMVDGKFAVTFELTSEQEIKEGEDLLPLTYKHKITVTKNGGSMYVIWYNGTITDKVDFYTESIGALDGILAEFKFSPIVEGEDITPENDKNAPEGMKLASNKDIVLYSLYVPNSWIIDESSAMTLAHVSNENKSSVSVMQWNITDDSTTVDDWWKNYHRAELEKTFDSFTVIEEGTPCTVDGKDGKSYTYTVEIANKTYKYLVTSVIDKGSVHVITYTSTPELYEETLTVVKEQILASFKFN